MLDIDGVRHYIEVKRWRIFHGAADERFLEALDQMRRDVVLLARKTLAEGEPNARIRWSFLLGVGGQGLKAADIPTLARQFADRLDDPALRTALQQLFEGQGRTGKVAIEAAGEVIENFKNMLRRGEILEGILG